MDEIPLDETELEEHYEEMLEELIEEEDKEV